MEKEQIHSKLKSLVQKFEANKYHYLSKNYLEEEVKIDFINPFFEVLGWDVRNTKGLSPYEREVVVEKGETLGRPDYNFRIDGQTKFFVEAKAPHEPLHKINHVLQAKSYAWNTKSVFIVLLTDFEEFRLFDATIKPDTKNPDQGLIFELTYDQYLDNVDKLMLLSKEEVEKGSLDKLILKDPKSKKLRIPVDKAFLADLSQWREELAKDIYKRNIKELEDRSDEKRVKIQVKILNEAVQKILNRLIFIRITEDRKIIEPKSLLDQVEWWKAGGKRRDLHRRLTNCFMGWNQDFDGEILKPGPCDILEIDSQLLAKIIDGLYFPKCPYLFDVIGVELLGSIYERYLGKTIRVTPKRVKIEERPEVRKAGGVYYTPQYIVDYIVKNTVGKTIKGKTPKRIKRIKILDPACGSGSFLLTAFQTLIDYHLDYYEKHPEESGQGTLFPDVIVDYDGTKRLSIEKKAQILRNNIYGVDIDPQAVEIAMMSLYLKCLEGEKDLPRKKELLPSLAKNIRCGNSLISYDIFDQLTLFDEEEKERINPFDWNSKSTGFGEIMKQGGFDVVIGNPPYVRIQVMKEWAPLEVEFYKKHYSSAHKGNYDIYVVFVEKGLSLLNEKGRLGFILPHKFFNAKYGEALRSLLTKGNHLNEIVHFGHQQVFFGATTYTCLFFLTKRRNEKFKFSKVSNLDFWQIRGESEKALIATNKATSNEWNFIIGKNANLLERLSDFPLKLRDVSNRIFQGLITGADSVFILNYKANKKYFSVATQQDYLLEEELLYPLCKGSVDIRRYHVRVPIKFILFPYKVVNGKAELLSVKELSERYPYVWQYLKANQSKLEARERGKWKNDRWYAFSRSQNLNEMEKKKILTPSIARLASFTLDSKGRYYFVGSGGGGGGGYGITLKKFEQIAYEYVLGLLNSKLLDMYMQASSTSFSGGYFAYNRQYIEQLPIRTIDFSNAKEKTMHDKMVDLVDKMLELNKKKAALPPSSKRDRIEREIQITDEKINELVYELYGITEKEKKVIKEEND